MAAAACLLDLIHSRSDGRLDMGSVMDGVLANATRCTTRDLDTAIRSRYTVDLFLGLVMFLVVEIQILSKATGHQNVPDQRRSTVDLPWALLRTRTFESSTFVGNPHRER